MLKRTIYIGTPTSLKLKDNQLIIGDPLTKAVKGSIPMEDMAVLVLDHYQITLSHQAMVLLQQHNVAIISCDQSHLPLGLMLPLNGHVTHSERVKLQINCSEPLKKQLWKQTVEAKIYQQKALLDKLGKQSNSMINYFNNVKSGDTTNMEGIAAQYYWKQLFADFTRERYGDAPNNFLNFGYAILRSMVARALVSSGLNPTIGIFHRNKYNAYCLADDIMEPYRPYVDEMVLEWINKPFQPTELTIDSKAFLMTIATKDVVIDGLKRPLLIAISSTTSSFVKCLAGEQRLIRYPELR